MSRLIFLALRRLARVTRPLVKWLIGAIFGYASFLLPVKRLYESGAVIAFRHPRPAYRIHILLAPKKAVADLVELSVQDSSALISAVLQAADEVAKDLELGKCGYRLILNGGGYQDLPQLHFHLIAE